MGEDHEKSSKRGWVGGGKTSEEEGGGRLLARKRGGGGRVSYCPLSFKKVFFSEREKKWRRKKMGHEKGGTALRVSGKRGGLGEKTGKID